MDQQRRLCIGFRPPLLPVLERPHIRTQVSCKKPARKIHVLAYLGKLASCDLWRGFSLQQMRTQRPLTGTLISQGYLQVATPEEADEKKFRAPCPVPPGEQDNLR